MCLCICGPRIFGITLLDTSHLSDTFDGFSPPVIMSNLNKFWSFTLGGGGGGGGGGGVGIYPILLRTTHVNFFFISFKTVRLNLEVVPCYRGHHRTPDIVSINHVPTTYHRTPNTISISTMHSHPCHAMFSCTCNVIMPLPTYTMLHIKLHAYMCATCNITIPWIIIINAYNSPPCTTHANTSYNIH